MLWCWGTMQVNDLDRGELCLMVSAVSSIPCTGEETLQHLGTVKGFLLSWEGC